MKRFTFNKFISMKVNEQRELLHNVFVATSNCQTVTAEMAFAYDPWKEAYEEMVEAYDTSYKSPESDEIHTLDQMCDNLLASGHGVANGLSKSSDPELASAAKEILQAYKSFKVNYSSSYISQKPQVDSLLNALLVTNRESVVKCGLLPVYERVKEFNDRMHELVDQRDQTSFDPQRIQKREKAIERYLDLEDYINGYWLVVLHKTNVPADLELLFTTLDNIFKRYDRVLGLGSNSSTRPGSSEEESETPGEEETTPPSTEPSDPGSGETEPQYSIAKFIFQSGESEEIRQLAGSVLHAPQNTEGYRWVPEVPATMPAVDTTYNEVAEGEPLYTIAWYDKSTPIQWYELPAGAAVPEAPEPPAGYRWAQTFTVMPARDVDIVAVAI